MKKIILFVIAIAIILLCVRPFLWWQNETFGITRYTVKGNIPQSFDGFKIVQISDLHCKDFDGLLAQTVRKEAPDIIVFTGDMIDEGMADHTPTYRFVEEIKDLAPIYSVSGNHDKWYDDFAGHQKKLKNLGVTALENKTVTLAKSNEFISLHGIEDPSIWADDETKKSIINGMDKLNMQEGYNVLLFHRANMLDQFKGMPFDLVLSGHMHGGQIRIPYLIGLRSPHGNWFPDYSGGRYRKGEQTFLVSRGLGGAVIIPRVFNRGEVVVTTLKKK